MTKKTNTVPNNVFKIPSSIIRLGKIYQFISTGVASRFAYKLFTTPPKFNLPERELMMRKSAKNILIEVPNSSHKVMMYEYGFSKTKVLLAHGWSGRGTQLYEIADKLLENGMMVIAYDAPAHGQSEGKTTTLLEAIQIAQHITEKYGPFEAAIGHSFGAMTLLNVQANKPSFKKIITIGQEGSLNKVIDEFVKKLKLQLKVATGIKKHIKKTFGNDVTSISGNEAAKKIDTDVLVIHDTQDHDVDVSSAFKLRQNLANGSLVITNGLGHRKILRDSKVITKIIDFIKN